MSPKKINNWNQPISTHHPKPPQSISETENTNWVSLKHDEKRGADKREKG